MLFSKKQFSSTKTIAGISPGYIVVVVCFFISLIGLKIWQYHWPEAHIAVGDTDMHVLIAKTPWHWQRGLGKRDDLQEFDGMLFLFGSERRHGIVMRDMQFPIDIIWLKGDTIVDIAPYVPLEPGVAEQDLRVYYPRTEANLVLETRAGFTAEEGIEIGDTLRVVRE
ncbi:MAG: DUF192 domain-containing protein [Candidatus Magasanikbacteria bacterium]|jgi:uncharacterized membrane protein (UPF0127 family)|nr:DUF192 domain-containing protein [Candidatus Magasanikbacteria bacterium]